MYPEREEIIDTLTDHNFNFLSGLPFEDQIYMNAMKEARGKFLANCHIVLSKSVLPRGYKNYRYSTDFVSADALLLLKQKKWDAYGLAYEHIIPKAEYIITKVEDAARSGELSRQFIKDMLIERLWTATLQGKK
ncbi:hypothetical protein ACTHO0_25625 [Cytobacillus praedii]